MTFKPGAPGRPLGAVSRGSFKFADTMRKHGFDIAQEMLDHYNEAMSLKETDRAIAILMNMAKFVYPTLKSVDNIDQNALDGMTPEQKLEAMKQAVRALEMETKK